MSTIEELKRNIWTDIELYGWHVIKIQEDSHGPSIVYSIGFHHSFDHPEVLIIGLDLEASHFLINRIGDAIKNGFTLQSGQFYTNLIEGVDCYFTSVEQKYYNDYIGYAVQFYNKIDFPLLQCIYPTLTGIYPWQEEWPKQLKEKQPVLGPPPSPLKGVEETPDNNNELEMYEPQFEEIREIDNNG